MEGNLIRQARTDRETLVLLGEGSFWRVEIVPFSGSDYCDLAIVVGGCFATGTIVRLPHDPYVLEVMRQRWQALGVIDIPEPGELGWLLAAEEIDEKNTLVRPVDLEGVSELFIPLFEAISRIKGELP